jgi:Peptidase family M28
MTIAACLSRSFLSASIVGYSLLGGLVSAQDNDIRSNSMPSYNDLSGVALKRDVEELTRIARAYQADGNQYWGRISGTKADKETEAWLRDRFTALGLKDVRVQEFSLPPQWFPTSWKVSVANAGKSEELTTVQPMLGSPGTAGGGIAAEAVYVGLGSSIEVDGRDLKGKAVVITTLPTGSIVRHSAASNGAIARAAAAGASAILLIVNFPGNIRSQLETAGGDFPAVPTFSVGAADGQRLLEGMKQSKTMLQIRLAVEQRSGLVTGSVWGSLPGEGAEQILIIAHHDSYFEGADDNASGIATMIGLAQHFAQQPASKRRRTITFVATPGHHAGMLGVNWLRDHMDFSRTAVIINCEHMASLQTYVGPLIERMNGPEVGSVLLKSDVTAPRWWYVGGSDTLRSLTLETFRKLEVGVFNEPEQVPLGELWALYRKAPSLQLIEAPLIYHTDLDRSDMVPADGLERATRTFAIIIDQVNKLSLAALRASP